MTLKLLDAVGAVQNLSTSADAGGNLVGATSITDPVSGNKQLVGAYLNADGQMHGATDFAALVAAGLLLFNGTGYDRLPGSTARGSDVNARSGFASGLNITAATLVKAAPGRLVRVSVVVPGTAAGSVNDAATVAAAAATNQIASVQATAGNVVLFDWPCLAGIVVTPGAGQTLAVSYT